MKKQYKVQVRGGLFGAGQEVTEVAILGSFREAFQKAKLQERSIHRQIEVLEGISGRWQYVYGYKGNTQYWRTLEIRERLLKQLEDELLEVSKGIKTVEVEARPC